MPKAGYSELLGADTAAECFRSLEHAHAQSLLAEERCAYQRVDPTAYDDDVEDARLHGLSGAAHYVPATWLSTYITRPL